MLNINLEHPEYVGCKAMWRKYKDLYIGGEQLREHAAEYLVRRSKEPNDVYFERLNRVFYENYIGSVIDWYAATLIRREPIVTYTGTNEAGQTFFTAFSEDLRPERNYVGGVFSPTTRAGFDNGQKLYRGGFSTHRRTYRQSGTRGCPRKVARLSG